jgi:hypothetical protein
MARVRRRRHRRTPPRGAGGRFKASHRRRHRRHRRNPVVPVSWSGNPTRRRRKSSRRRRNPLFLSRRGFSRRKHRGYRRLHRRRRSPRHWHNNPVLPFFAFNGKRRRKSHGRRHHRRSRRHSYRRNPVLPFFAFNPGGGAGSIMNRMSSMMDVRFWTETALPVAGGFFGSKLVGSQLYGLIFSSGSSPLAAMLPLPTIPYVRLALNAVSGAGMAWAAEKFVSKKVADGIWIGTIVGVASSLLKNLLDAFAPGVSSQLGLSGLAGLDGDISSQMKDAVVRRVQANLGTYMTKNSLNRGIVRPSLSAYQTRAALQSATYDPSPRGMMSDYDVTNTDTTL